MSQTRNGDGRVIQRHGDGTIDKLGYPPTDPATLNPIWDQYRDQLGYPPKDEA
jgi:hypothetical protein